MIRLHLQDYDPSWPQQYERHRERIANALCNPGARIEHIGSTAVPGLAAKPVIDILLEGVPHDDPSVRTALEHAGYELAVDEPGHRMYKTPVRDAHVHLWAQAGDAQRHVVFRDWLREHPEDRELYAHVKRVLTAREWKTRDDYADAKDAVVETIMRRARGEQSQTRIDAFAGLLLGMLPPRSPVLEIGAGEGLLARALASAGHEVVALDKALRSTFAVREVPFEEYDAPARSFTCVAAQLVLHHVSGLHAMLEKAAALLEPGGILAIDDYGWERSADEAYREQRRDLHTSMQMLTALRERFDETLYIDHEHVRDPAGTPLGFTFIGTPR